MATNAPIPDGYALVFTNLDGSMTAPSYMGLYTLTSYDTLGCASKCDQASGCEAFNIYIERDPTLCSMYNQTWGPSYATNYGHYRGSDRYTVSRAYIYSLS